MDYISLAEEYLSHISEMNRVESAVRRSKRTGDVHRGEMFVMVFMRRCGESICPGRISREAEISTARVAAVLNSLEKKGFVSRTPCEDDRRMSMVSLTEAGKAYVDEKRTEMLEYHAMILKTLGEEDASELVRLLGRLAESERKNSELTQEIEPDD